MRKQSTEKVSDLLKATKQGLGCVGYLRRKGFHQGAHLALCCAQSLRILTLIWPLFTASHVGGLKGLSDCASVSPSKSTAALRSHWMAHILGQKTEKMLRGQTLNSNRNVLFGLMSRGLW